MMMQFKILYLILILIKKLTTTTLMIVILMKKLTILKISMKDYQNLKKLYIVHKKLKMKILFFMQFYMQQDIILQKKLIKCQMKKLKKIFRKYLKKCTT